MARRSLDLEKLFEPRKPPTGGPYPSLEAELDAVAAGTKHVSSFSVILDDMSDRDSHYFQALELAFERELVVVLHSEPPPRNNELLHTSVFVTRPDQLWRVPALLAVGEARMIRYSFDEPSRLALELQRSVLLGYTPAQCTALVSRMRQREEGLYVLLAREQRRCVVAHAEVLDARARDRAPRGMARGGLGSRGARALDRTTITRASHGGERRAIRSHRLLDRAGMAMRARAFDPAVLFEKIRISKDALADDPFAAQRPKLARVRPARKPISRERRTIADVMPRLAVPALRRGLVVALSAPRGEDAPIDVHACRLEELWRVSALIAAAEQPLPLGSTDGVEAHVSTLLGYSQSERARWLRHRKRMDNFYAYTLLSPEQADHVRTLGSRCFGTVDQVTGMTFFVHRHGPLKEGAHGLVPRDLTLARTPLDASLQHVLLGDVTKSKRRQGLSKVRMSRRQARAFTEHMHANVELLGRAGWQ